MTTVFSASLAGADSGWGGYTFVQSFSAAALAAATGTQVRITLDFQGLSSGYTIAVYMAKQGAGDAYDFANTPAHITFGGGDIVTVTDVHYVSDWVNLPETYDEAVNYVIAVQFVGAGTVSLKTASATGVNSYYKLAADAATVNKTGYTTNTTNTVGLISLIEIQSVGGATTLTAAAGSYALSGSNAALAGQAKADPGSYTISGAINGLAIRQTAAAGSYALSGTAAALTISNNITLTAAGGSYALAGSTAAFVIPGSLVFPAASGSYALTGSPVTFLGVTPPPSTDNYTGGASRGRMIRKRRKREDEEDEQPIPVIGSTPVPAPPPSPSLPPPPSLMADMPMPPRTVLHSPPDDDDEEAVALLLELLS